MSLEFDQVLIEKLRVLVYDYSRKHLNEIDWSDVTSHIARSASASTAQKVKIRDLWLKRLLKWAKKPGDLESALEKFVEIFQFRKQYQVKNMNVANVCPAEFYRIQPLFIGGRDLNGNRLFIIRIRYYQTLTQFDAIIKHFLVYHMEQQDKLFEQGQHSGLTLVIDCQEFNYRHLR